MSFDYDVVIIGSGFGGSVAALRAAEKGYRVGVMEAGKRWNDEDIPKTQWDLPRFLWFPAAELFGIQRIEYLDDVLILCGAGVGGGSHVYGNTLYVPPKRFFDAPEWAYITDWADELAPCIDQARRMFGVLRYPYMPTDVDRYMRQVAIGLSDAIANGSVVTYYLDDRKLRISIARVGDRLYAFDDLCTCAQQTCPLSGGLLTGTTIMCQCHGSRFDITTGAVINGPATDALNVYDVQEVEGGIQITAHFRG